MAASAEVKRPKPINQYHKVGEGPAEVAFDKKDISNSMETERQAREDERLHESNVKSADAYWSERAKEKDWDCIKADLSVYRYSGQNTKNTGRQS